MSRIEADWAGTTLAPAIEAAAAEITRMRLNMIATP
jgi:hypothetical protein